VRKKQMQIREELRSYCENLLWSWKPWYREFLRDLNPEHFDIWENPVSMLREMPDADLDALSGDKEFQGKIKKFRDTYNKEIKKAASRCPDSLESRTIAYFSAEYGIHTSLPIYSGGLGILSGDHIKSSHDLGLPFVGVGLFYRQGYFNQRIDLQGKQHADLRLMDPENLAVNIVTDDKRIPLEVSVELPGRELVLNIWKAKVGNSVLYLLDSDNVKNSDIDRKQTWQLYGGDRDTRIIQEIILGIGGVRALRKLGIDPDVWHMNEGHSAFLAVERVNELMHSEKMSMPQAVEAVAANTIFTTHTPVTAGNEAFILSRLQNFFSGYCEKYNIDFHSLLELGTQMDKNGYKTFSLTALAIRLSRSANGVSKLHGDVSRKMWYHLWHQVPIPETPIGHVTNGIHTASWVGSAFRDLYQEVLGEDWEESLLNQEAWEAIRDVPDKVIWDKHQVQKSALLEEVKHNVRERLSGSNIPVDSILARLDPKALVITFARRFATYKRADLIFDDLDRLDKIVNNPARPVIFLFAGKAHPADIPGQKMIRRINEISLDKRFHGRIVLLEKYDIKLAKYLVQGSDVWLNTPRRPMEASGTSGQKVCANAGINFSILDGWWEEGYHENNGWKIGRDIEYGDDRIQDYYDVRDLYSTIEKKIVPCYFDCDTTGLSSEWISYMRESIISLTAEYSTSRMVNDYVVKYYNPSILKGDKAFGNNWKVIRDFVSYKESLLKRWYHMTDMWLESNRSGKNVDVKLGLYLGLLRPDEVRVELCMRHNGVVNTQDANLIGPADEDGVWIYELKHSCSDVLDCKLKMRVLPKHEYLDHDMEMGMCYWFHKKIS
jgi:glycogen phosphorylase